MANCHHIGDNNKMKKLETTLIIFIGLLFIGCVLVFNDLQMQEEEKVNIYSNQENTFEYLMKGIYIMDTFNPIRKASYYKCEMGKTYPYSLS